MSEWFSQVTGHEEAKRTLRRSLRSGRLRGSFLLVGPAGVGKALLGQELAMAINCQGAPAPRPCRACGPCHRIGRELSGDYVVVRPAGAPSIGIAQVRQALEELALAPVESATRVFVFDPAGALTEPAQNALLKGLEEPPPRALLLLLAEREEELLPTVASRCRVIRVGELSPAQVESILRQRGLEGEELRARAGWSGGSVGRALAEDTLVVAALAEQLLDSLTSGETHRDPMASVELLAEYVRPGAGEARARRARIGAVSDCLRRALRDALMQRELGEVGAAGPRLSGADPARLAQLAGLPRGRLERGLDRLDAIEEQLDANLNTKFLLDGLILDLGEALAPARQWRRVPAC